jgi:hypothetical protein
VVPTEANTRTKRDALQPVWQARSSTRLQEELGSGGRSAFGVAPGQARANLATQKEKKCTSSRRKAARCTTNRSHCCSRLTTTWGSTEEHGGCTAVMGGDSNQRREHRRGWGELTAWRKRLRLGDVFEELHPGKQFVTYRTNGRTDMSTKKQKRICNLDRSLLRIPPAVKQSCHLRSLSAWAWEVLARYGAGERHAQHALHRH